MRWRRAAVTAAMGLAGFGGLAGSAVAETLRVQGVFAAGAREASFLPTIGVGPIGGPYGEDLGEAIGRRLAAMGDENGGNAVPHATLVPDSLRPDGLLTGHTDLDVADSDYTESRERCTEKKDGKCVAKQRYTVACTRRSVAFRADLGMTRRRDGARVYTASRSREDRSDWCEDRGVASDVGFLVRGMADSIASDVRLDLAPHAEDYTIRIREERDGLSADVAHRFKEAVHLTKRDPAAACAAFAAIDRAVPDNGSTTFNLALCAEAAGRYAEAGDRYTRARLFAPKAAGAVTKGLERVASLAAGAEDVAAMRARPPVRGTGF